MHVQHTSTNLKLCTVFLLTVIEFYDDCFCSWLKAYKNISKAKAEGLQRIIQLDINIHN